MNDIESLIKYVKDHSNNFLGSKATLKENETFEYMYDLLIDILEQQLTNGWIPVSEHAPKNYSEVFVTLDNKSVYHATYKNENYYLKGEHDIPIIGNVVAWIPYYTPEPYKEVSE